MGIGDWLKQIFYLLKYWRIISGLTLGWPYSKTKMAETNIFSFETSVSTAETTEWFLIYVIETLKEGFASILQNVGDMMKTYKHKFLLLI